jgi:aryl-alcohol dehydrogenase-like predicted oxidoreductase
METEMRAESLGIVRKLDAHCRSRGVPIAHFALAWTLNNALVSSVLAGPRTLEQWRHYLAALDYRFGAEDEALVDRLVPPGHASTPGYTDPKFPVAGRVPCH